MTLTTPNAPGTLARRVREQFVAELEACLEPLSLALATRLLEQVDRSTSTREAHERRDAMLEYERLRASWAAATRLAWRRGAAGLAGAAPPAAGGDLSLLDHDEVERKIIASRLAMSLQEAGGWDFNDLLRRMQQVEGVELPASDVIRPEGLAQHLVESWMASGLPRRTWLLAGDFFQQQLGPVVSRAWQRANQSLIDAGVLPDIGAGRRVRRSPDAAARPPGAPGTGPGGLPGGSGASGGGGGASGMGLSTGGGLGFGGGSGRGTPTGTGEAGPGAASAWGQVPPDSRLAAGVESPLARVRSRAQGLLGRMRRLIGERVADFDPGQPVVPSPALSVALGPVGSTLLADPDAFDDRAVARIAQALREQSGELKRQAGSSTEKALIEVVALMFQSILAEERIPPAVRVWFARLQMPVLRVALAEPDFFESLQHPARLLIDRMGACVLGFDGATIDGSEMEAEIRRIVQLVEQYPETGRKVFLMAHEEFQKFLSRYLTDQAPATRRVVTVAQQVEQKETMAVRYTIELRRMLDDMPVPAGIREFLFKVWAEVMAVAAVRHGAQHPDTIALKKSAAELVWAAGAKPNRAERAQVIQGLPQLLQRLRQGMTLLGLPAAEQDAQLKTLSDTLADAFQSRTAPIPTARIEAIADCLTNLESLAAGFEADLPLDAESLGELLGEEARGVEIVTDGGVRPGAAMMAWARELQPGAWFRLDHNGEVEPVQYAWRSEGGQLHLFTAPGGRCVLLQVGRLAAYLQAGLLVPHEDEALTVRATRDALAKLDANPERLLAA
ncbi:DUF1631 family protein [Ramlibacter sp. MAHUQ-53]|uniref:DUF1631 family protein n=1 Tax=unclassified Ramlibacter TaxID=2617605 RepID=UPI003630B8BA